MEYISLFNRKLGEYGSIAAYFAIFIITVYDVAMRYFFNSPTVWGLELVITIAAMHYVLAGAYVLDEDMHVRIDVIYNLLPRKARLVMDVVAIGLSMIFLAVIFYYGGEQALPAIQNGERSGGGWNSHAPMLMKAAIPCGAALMILTCVGRLKIAIGRLSHEW
ncbi:MAG: TRAP transporter small permease [Rhodospirillum sp.]|nr:TRAP transporter small permease [Rhodospirillum sp.]MCF8488327.1 TRAP transporter small permease [Rhodospirillum sp.]MCF8500748.1 TRAP transporter small permease [Rhodospirillum sp.]